MSGCATALPMSQPCSLSDENRLVRAGHQAQSVQVVESTGPVGIVRRKLGAAVKEGVWPNGAGHEPGTGECGPILKFRPRFHQQRRDACDRKRSHAGAVGRSVAGQRSAATRGGEASRPYPTTFGASQPSAVGPWLLNPAMIPKSCTAPTASEFLAVP